MPKTKALVPLKGPQIDEIFKSEKSCDEILSRIEEYALSFAFDISKSKGRKDCISHAADVKRTIATVTERAAEITKGMRAKIKDVNEVRDKVKDRLKPIAEKIREPVTAWEEEEKKKAEEEKKRITDIREKIDSISCHKPRNDKGVPILPEQAAAKQLEAGIEELDRIDLNEEFFKEFHEEALEAKSKRLEELSSILKFRQEQEALEEERLRVEKERLRIEEEKAEIEKEKQARQEEAEAQEALRKTNLSALMTRISACVHDGPWKDAKPIEKSIETLESIVIDDSYQERKEEAEDMKRTILADLKEGLPIAEKADREEIEKEERRRKEESEKLLEEEKKKEAEKKAAREKNIEHRRSINRAVIDIFMSAGVTEETAIELLKAVIKSKSELITINY